MTLTEAKDQIAQQHDFDTWAEMDKAMDESGNLFHPLNNYERWQDLHGEAARLYAIEKVKEALKLAGERVKLTWITDLPDGLNRIVIDKDSILSLETELIEALNKEI